MMKKIDLNFQGILYRVACNDDTMYQGLWYNSDGIPGGLINVIPNAQAAGLPMVYDPIFSDQGKKWLSATDTKDNLKLWFSPDDIKYLTGCGFNIYGIIVPEYRTIEFAGLKHEIFREDLILSRRVIPVEEIF